MITTLFAVCVASAIHYRFIRSKPFIEIIAGTNTAFSIDPEARELIWSGQLSYYMPNILFGTMAQYPEGPWTLVLKDISGGSVDSASTIAGLGEQHGIHTSRVEGKCYSMCANLWASFPNLEIVEGSTLGWHGMYDAETGEPMRASIDNALVPFLISKGFPEELVRNWVDLPPDEIHEMTAADLERLGIPVKRIARLLK